MVLLALFLQSQRSNLLKDLVDDLSLCRFLRGSSGMGEREGTFKETVRQS